MNGSLCLITQEWLVNTLLHLSCHGNKELDKNSHFFYAFFFLNVSYFCSLTKVISLSSQIEGFKVSHSTGILDEDFI